MKTDDYLRQYLELRKPRLSPSTFASYEDILSRFLIPFFGEKDLEEITALDIEIFLSGILSSGYSAATTKRIYSILRSAFSKAVKLSLIKENPSGREKIDPLPRGHREIQIFSPQEVHKIMCALSDEPLMWHCYIRAAIDSGARRGELVALQWADIENGCCHIKKAAYKLRGQPAAIKPPKNGKSRDVHLTSETLQLLEQLRRNQRKDCLKAGRGWTKQNFIFGNMGKMLHPTTPTKWWRGFLRRHELPHRPLHSLRHTSATLLLSNGVDIKTVSSRLGHSSLEVTEIYLHLVDESDQRASDVLQRIL